MGRLAQIIVSYDDSTQRRACEMIDWNQIDTVFLDMDGTLLDLHYDNHFWLTHLPKRYAELKNLDAQEAHAHLHSMFQEHHGSLNWYCLDFWEQALDLDLMPLKHEVADKIAYRPNAKKFLQALKQSPRHTALVTNAHQGSIDIKFQYTDLKMHVDDVVTSHDFRVPKEDVAFWDALQQHKPFDPERTVFIDDNEAVLASARASGLKHLISIATPDSSKDERSDSDYPLLKDFDDVLPT